MNRYVTYYLHIIGSIAMADESEAAAAFKAKILAIIDTTEEWQWALMNGREIDVEQQHTVICACESSPQFLMEVCLTQSPNSFILICCR